MYTSITNHLGYFNAVLQCLLASKAFTQKLFYGGGEISSTNTHFHMRSLAIDYAWGQGELKSDDLLNLLIKYEPAFFDAKRTGDSAIALNSFLLLLATE